MSSDRKGDEDHKPIFRVEVESSTWLKNCFVGRLLVAVNVQFVESFLLRGFNFVEQTVF